MHRFIRGLAAGAVALALGTLFAGGSAAAAIAVHFVPGTYHLSDTNLGAPVDQLDVTVSGGIAHFVLTGADSATWDVVDRSTPDFDHLPGSVEYLTSSLPSYSWPGAFNQLWFYAVKDGGGLFIGNNDDTFVDLFASNTGPGQVFTIGSVPEPASWAMMIAGFFGLGGLIRRKGGDVLA